MLALPFNIDVTHFLSCDAFLVQDNILGVPDDHTEVESKNEHMLKGLFALVLHQGPGQDSRISRLLTFWLSGV